MKPAEKPDLDAAMTECAALVRTLNGYRQNTGLLDKAIHLLGYLEQAKAYIEQPLEVVIEVHGGVASVESRPPNVNVRIFDDDVAHCDECGSNDVMYVCEKCGTYYCGQHTPNICCPGEYITKFEED